MPEKCTEPCSDLTKLEQQVADLQKQHREDHAELRDRLIQLEKEEAVQQVQYKTILEKLELMDAKHDRHAAKLESLEAKPAKHWDGLVKSIVSSVVGAVVGFMMASIGLVK